LHTGGITYRFKMATVRKIPILLVTDINEVFDELVTFLPRYLGVTLNAIDAPFFVYYDLITAYSGMS